MATTQATPLHTLDQIKRRHEGRWFDAESMRFFRTRILSDIVLDRMRERTLFLTSEPYVWDGPRVYTVRAADWATGKVSTVGEMGEHESLPAARRALALAAVQRAL